MSRILHPHPNLIPAPSRRGLKTPEGIQWQRDFFLRANFVPVVGFDEDPPKYEDALSEVIKSQEALHWDPKHPRGSALILFGAIMRKLPGSQSSRLRIYCAAGSHLDIGYCADGFLAYEDWPTKSAVPFDLRLTWRRMVDFNTIIVTKRQFDSRLDDMANLFVATLNIPENDRRRKHLQSLWSSPPKDLQPRYQ